MKKGERNSLVLTWNTTRDFSSRYWEMDVPTTAPLSTRRQQILSEASQTFQVDLLVWGISKRSRYRETRIQPDWLGLNSEAFQHQCIVSCYYRESSYETSRFEFDFWRAFRVQRSSDLNDAHTLCPENTPGDKHLSFSLVWLVLHYHCLIYPYTFILCVRLTACEERDHHFVLYLNCTFYKVNLDQKQDVQVLQQYWAMQPAAWSSGQGSISL